MTHAPPRPDGTTPPGDLATASAVAGSRRVRRRAGAEARYGARYRRAWYDEGLGGWTWHTGAAGWMYQLIATSLLGLQRRGDRLTVTPCVPADWPGYTLRYRFRSTPYTLVMRPAAPGEARGQVTLDGVRLDTRHVPLIDDRLPHEAGITY